MKIFITDNDGVIFDRMPIYRAVFKTLASDYGADPEKAATYYYESAGKPIDDQFAEIFRRNGAEISDKEIVDVIVPEFFRQASLKEPSLFPGADRTLKRIRDLGFHIFVTSGSNTLELIALWRKYNLYANLILGSSEIKKGDEHIEFFAKHARLTTIDFCKVAHLLGDGRSDMELAKRNHIRAIGITNTVEAKDLFAGGADRVITQIDEVLDLLH